MKQKMITMKVLSSYKNEFGRHINKGIRISADTLTSKAHLSYFFSQLFSTFIITFFL